MKKKTIQNDIVDEESRAIYKVKISDFIMMTILFILCLTCILPFLHIGAKSISSTEFVVAKKVFFWPIGINFEAYTSIFRDGSLTYSMGYSVIVTIIFTVIGMIVCCCAAYPLSKRRLKGRTFLAFILLFPMYFGAGLIPSYLLYKNLHILDTPWVLILPLVYSPYNMLIMKTYFQSSIPDSLEESAFLDGASNIQILRKIILPLSKPIIATLSLFYAVGRWNAYSDAMYFIKSQKYKPIQYMLSQMVSSASEAQTISLSEASAVTSSPEVLQAAMIMFVTLPVICIYPFIQKYFTKGVMIGAVKG